MPPQRTLSSPNPPDTAPGTVLVETDRLIVRRYLPTDAPALAEAGNHIEVWEYMTDRFPSPYTVADAEDFISGAYSGSQGNPPEYPTPCGVFLKRQPADGDQPEKLIGSMGFTPGSDINYRMWELGYFFTPSAWGKGYATEAVGAYVRWMFATWPQLLRVQASTYAFNDRSGRVLEKCGFVREGFRRDSAEKCGKVVGEITYGLIRRDLEK